MGLFGSFGVMAAFLPALLLQNGLSAAELGIVLASGTAIRLLAGPLLGNLADRSGHHSLFLTALAAAAAIIATGYAPARGLPLLLLVSIAHSVVQAPMTPIADALALGSARTKPGFEYGWVRAAGSAAFIAGTLLAGLCVGLAGLETIVWLNAGLFAATACLAWLIPNRVANTYMRRDLSESSGSFSALLRIPAFRRLMIIAALVGGSHALHDGFEVIRWQSAGLSAGQASLLWSVSVAAEVIVFLSFGRKLLGRLGPANAMILSACAGIVRWGVTAETAWFPFMALVEPLHGLTFALLHLACMDVIGRVVPSQLAATAQSFYANVAMGAMSATVTLAAASLYGSFGAAAFWAMAVMCALALPFAWQFRAPAIAY